MKDLVDALSALTKRFDSNDIDVILNTGTEINKFIRDYQKLIDRFQTLRELDIASGHEVSNSLGDAFDDAEAVYSELVFFSRFN